MLTKEEIANKKQQQDAYAALLYENYCLDPEQSLTPQAEKLIAYHITTKVLELGPLVRAITFIPIKQKAYKQIYVTINGVKALIAKHFVNIALSDLVDAPLADNKILVTVKCTLVRDLGDGKFHTVEDFGCYAYSPASDADTITLARLKAVAKAIRRALQAMLGFGLIDDALDNIDPKELLETAQAFGYDPTANKPTTTPKNNATPLERPSPATTLTNYQTSAQAILNAVFDCLASRNLEPNCITVKLDDITRATTDSEVIELVDKIKTEFLEKAFKEDLITPEQYTRYKDSKIKLGTILAAIK